MQAAELRGNDDGEHMQYCHAQQPEGDGDTVSLTAEEEAHMYRRMTRKNGSCSSYEYCTSTVDGIDLM